ncbi:MAG: hydantoinase/oxoprolinase family protein [Pseudomonadota bacterium]
MSARLAADIGGTFTDLILINEDQTLQVHKTPSTPDDFKNGVLTGVNEITAGAPSLAQPLSGIDYFVHGATVVLNALIQRRLPATALVTTAGFRDVLEIMRTNNPYMYDMQYVKPAPLIPRRLRFEVIERVRHTGEVVTALDPESVRRAAQAAKKNGVAAVGVCLLHAYANSAHERRVREIFNEECPGMVVCLSSEVAGELREFERTSTTAINATTVPIITSYLDRLTDELRDMGLQRDLCVMQSNGGVITAGVARTLPVRTVMSGPSGGVVGGTHLCNEIGLDDVVTLDMGGTSTDIGVVSAGRALTVDESNVDGWPILAPMIEILAIGAGGGSIAWIDAGGGLRVGPQSAGAEPGPVCYQRGGSEPTVSDACAVLGRLNPDYFLGGRMTLDMDGATEVVKRKVAAPLSMDPHEAAAGVVTVVTANMAKAVRQILVARGLDPRDFTLMAFGGAGGMVVGDLLRASDVQRAVVPNNPGALCAMGMLVTDFRHDTSATLVRGLSHIDQNEVMDLFLELETKAIERLLTEGVTRDEVEVERFIDVRYVGQEYYLRIPIAGELINADKLGRDFNAEHERNYGYATREFPCEIVNLRVKALGLVERPSFPQYPTRGADDAPLSPTTTRAVFFDGAFRDTDIYKVDDLRANDEISGPAVIEDPRSTTVILPGQAATVDRLRNIHIHNGPR